MSRTNRKRPGARPGGPRRRITVRSTKRTPPDLRKLSRALLDLGATLLTLREVNREAGELEELFTAGTPAILDPIGQRLSRSERLGQIKTSAFSAILVLGLEGVEVARNRRVRETSQHLGLSLEELE